MREKRSKYNHRAWPAGQRLSYCALAMSCSRCRMCWYKCLPVGMACRAAFLLCGTPAPSLKPGEAVALLCDTKVLYYRRAYGRPGET